MQLNKSLLLVALSLSIPSFITPAPMPPALKKLLYFAGTAAFGASMTKYPTKSDECKLGLTAGMATAAATVGYSLTSPSTPLLRRLGKGYLGGIALEVSFVLTDYYSWKTENPEAPLKDYGTVWKKRGERVLLPKSVFWARECPDTLYEKFLEWSKYNKGTSLTVDLQKNTTCSDGTNSDALIVKACLNDPDVTVPSFLKAYETPTLLEKYEQWATEYPNASPYIFLVNYKIK
ncbi:hypothetical protein HOM50_01000 [bacterium]|jgi:hypothetical protein|nr:hypothetical protein [bacterium]MBT5014968.1 hypothetical protein [bacterium]